MKNISTGAGLAIAGTNSEQTILIPNTTEGVG